MQAPPQLHLTALWIRAIVCCPLPMRSIVCRRRRDSSAVSWEKRSAILAHACHSGVICFIFPRPPLHTESALHLE